MTRIAFAALGVLVLAGCERSPTIPASTGQPAFAAVAGGGLPIRDVAAGDLFSCALNALGAAFCWGRNTFGMLGTGDTEDATTPRRALGDVGFASIQAAGTHACALAPDGTAHCWGLNSAGEVGAQTSDVCFGSTGVQLDCSLQPVPVSGDLRFHSIDVGWAHNCGLTAQGEAYCWGWNEFGQLGTTTGETCLRLGVIAVPCSRTPVAVDGGLRFKSISAGFWHTCGLTFDDQTLCWGNNILGTFGNGTRASSGPTPIPGANGVTLNVLSTGSGAACGITTDRVTVCWGGFNAAGELGDGTKSPHLVPQPIVGDFVSVRSVNTSTENNVLAHVCGISPTGETSCWGSNRRGQLGVPTADICTFSILPPFTCSTVPVPVAGDHRFGSVALGNEHTCGVTKGGDVLCWGFNNRGQLGDGTTTDRPEPVRVELP